MSHLYPHLTDGICECMCSECTAGAAGDVYIAGDRCICPECNQQECGLHDGVVEHHHTFVCECGEVS